MGLKRESDYFFAEYLAYAEKDNSIYKNLSLAAYYSYEGDTEKAIEHMRLFSQQDSYFYWTVIFLKLDDPLFDHIRDLTEYRKIVKDIETKFWKSHDEISTTLEKQKLL